MPRRYKRQRRFYARYWRRKFYKRLRYLIRRIALRTSIREQEPKMAVMQRWSPYFPGNGGPSDLLPALGRESGSPPSATVQYFSPLSSILVGSKNWTRDDQSIWLLYMKVDWYCQMTVQNEQSPETYYTNTADAHRISHYWDSQDNWTFDTSLPHAALTVPDYNLNYRGLYNNNWLSPLGYTYLARKQGIKTLYDKYLFARTTPTGGDGTTLDRASGRYWKHKTWHYDYRRRPVPIRWDIDADAGAAPMGMNFVSGIRTGDGEAVYSMVWTMYFRDRN